MKSRKELIVEFIYKNSYGEEKQLIAFTTDDIAERLDMQRTYVSTILNELIKDGTLEKKDGRPVKYRLNGLSDAQHQEKAVFANFIGYEHSLKYVIQDLKAALVYPGTQKNLLLEGEHGVGKTSLAQAAFQYAKENMLLSLHMQMAVLDCITLSFYLDEEKEQSDLFQELAMRYPKKDSIAFLIIEHIELIPMKYHSSFYHVLTSFFQHTNILISTLTDTDITQLERHYIQKAFDFAIAVPPLQQYQMKERFQLVAACFNQEAQLLNKKIKVDSILLKCLFCYSPKGNMAQVYEDIKQGCANGFSRIFRKTSDEETLFLLIKDFPQDVRKGLLDYPKQSIEVNDFLKERSCVFDGYQHQFESLKTDSKKVKVSLTQTFDAITSKLMSIGASSEEITTLLSADAVPWLQQYQEMIASHVKDEDALMKLVDRAIMNIVKNLMEEAQEKLHRIYSDAAYYAICVLVADILKEKRIIDPMLHIMVQNVPKQCKAEFEIAKGFANQLTLTFGKIIQEQDISFIALLLVSVESLATRTKKKPIVLFVSHGKDTATSVCKCIRELSHNYNIYGYDLCLEKDLDTVYHELKELVLRLDHGRGILLIYDMGSIAQMGAMLQEETDVDIRMIRLPQTLFLLEASKKADAIDDLNLLFDDVQTSAAEAFTMIDSGYYRSKEKYTVIVLSKEGRSEVIQIKEYIERSVDLHGVTDIIPIATSDKNFLLREVNKLRKVSKILCIIGSYDPKLYRIPFLSFAKVLSIPKNKLMFLLYYESIDIAEITDDTQRIYTNLVAQLPILKSHDFKTLMTQSLEQLEHTGVVLSKEEEIQFIIDVAYTIANGLQGMNRSFHKSKKKLILHHKVLYNSIKECLANLEQTYAYQLNDHDIANMIDLLTKKDE